MCQSSPLSLPMAPKKKEEPKPAAPAAPKPPEPERPKTPDFDPTSVTVKNQQILLLYAQIVDRLQIEVVGEFNPFFYSIILDR